MTGFFRSRHTLTCDGLDLEGLATTFGTPTHVYSAAVIAERVRALDAAFADVPHRLHYALKANSTLSVVRLMRSLGLSADANSGGELEVALRAGFSPSQIVFTGVGKTRDELARAVTLAVAAINAESFGEIERIAAIAELERRQARLAIRINPDVEAGTHRHIATGGKATKFGVSLDEARAMIRDVAAHPALRLVGLHVHVGSQITQAEPIARAARVVGDLARDLLSHGVPLEHLDVGGGLGIQYSDGQPVLGADEYARAIVPALAGTGLTLLLEPGRWLVGPAGVLLTRVVDLKPKLEGGAFVIVDAGMTDLLRPALYGAWHEIEAATPRPGDPIRADVVGPVCETADTLGSLRSLTPVEVGDLLVIRDTGAYGAVMASNYNRRPVAAEVLVEDGQARLARRRQTVDDMLQWDV